MSEPARIAVLRQVPLFSGLDETVLAELAARSRLLHCRANHILFHEEDEGDSLYVIVRGSVRIELSRMVYDPSTGQEVLKAIPLACRRAGDHFGEMALLDGKPRMADAVTIEACDLLRLVRADFERCLEQSPRMALSIMACLADRLREAAAQLKSTRALDVLGRVSEALLEYGSLYGEATPSGGTRISQKLTHQQIADQIGTTRESVSRALSSLQQVGAIGRDAGRLVLLKPNRLRDNCLI